MSPSTPSTVENLDSISLLLSRNGHEDEKHAVIGGRKQGFLSPQ